MWGAFLQSCPLINNNQHHIFFPLSHSPGPIPPLPTPPHSLLLLSLPPILHWIHHQYMLDGEECLPTKSKHKAFVVQWLRLLVATFDLIILNVQVLKSRGYPGSIPGNRTSPLNFCPPRLYSSVGRAFDWSLWFALCKSRFSSKGQVFDPLWRQTHVQKSTTLLGQVTKWLRCCIKAAVGQPARVQIASCSYLFDGFSIDELTFLVVFELFELFELCVLCVPSFQNWFKIVPRMGLCCCPCWVVSGVVSLWCWCGYGWWARLGWVCHV